MPLQNRVTPFGTLIATDARGAWLGNRGILHDADGRLTGRRWTTLGWVTCKLSFKGRQRKIMSPRRYTELFFLDEATALAAGHRPCFECRRADALAFQAAWQQANGGDGVSADTMNRVVHPERKRSVETRPVIEDAAQLPAGAMITLPNQPAEAWLIGNGTMMRWSPHGYTDPQPVAKRRATLLTPPSTVATLATGYTPQIHETAFGVI